MSATFQPRTGMVHLFDAFFNPKYSNFRMASSWGKALRPLIPGDRRAITHNPPLISSFPRKRESTLQSSTALVTASSVVPPDRQELVPDRNRRGGSLCPPAETHNPAITPSRGGVSETRAPARRRAGGGTPISPPPPCRGVVVPRLASRRPEPENFRSGR